MSINKRLICTVESYSELRCVHYERVSFLLEINLLVPCTGGGGGVVLISGSFFQRGFTRGVSSHFGYWVQAIVACIILILILYLISNNYTYNNYYY